MGAGENFDFTNIGNLLGGKPGGPGNIIYENFKALKQAMVQGGGDIDAIDFDNEDKMSATLMINFGITLANAGYKHVTFCPWTSQSIWKDTMKGLVATQGAQFVNAIHLQCYSGGRGNVSQVQSWIDAFKAVGGQAAMIPGLATNQSEPGPWWDGTPNTIGKSVHTVPNVAVFEGANWDNFLYTQNFPTIEAALKGAKTAASRVATKSTKDFL